MKSLLISVRLSRRSGVSRACAKISGAQVCADPIVRTMPDVDEQAELELGDYIRVLRKNRPLIGCATVLGGIAADGLFLVATPPSTKRPPRCMSPCGARKPPPITSIKAVPTPVRSCSRRGPDRGTVGVEQRDR